MSVDLLITGISQLVTAEGGGRRCGAAMSELRVIEGAALAVAAGRVVWIGEASAWLGDADVVVDAGGRAVVPGLVDPHTHSVWAGDRLQDFDARTSGATYESILATGGGIRRTIRATAAASLAELVALAKPRLAALVQSGATVIEVKSGYGFAASAEIAMLESVQVLAGEVEAKLLATLLIHLPPADARDRAGYVREVCDELIPEVARRRLATAADVFVEKEAWPVAEAELMFRAAQDAGLAIKLHCDQFHCVGGVELGVRMKALSADHLEASGAEQIEMLATGSTIATLLPGVSLHLGLPGAPGRKLIDAGVAVAVGTDLNPGSSPLFSTAAALGLAVRMNGLTPKEALIAGTVNAAQALGLEDAGRLEPGCPADFLVLHGSDWRELIYMLGANPVSEVWIGGKKVVG